MPAQRLVLVVLSVMLGLCAMSGVIVLYVDFEEWLLPLLGVIGITLLGVGLMLLLSFLLDQARYRPAAIISMAIITLLWLSGLGMIWALSPGVSEWYLGDIGLTAVFTLMMGIPAMISSLFLAMPAARLAARAQLAVCGFAWAMCEFGACARLFDHLWYGFYSTQLGQYLSEIALVDGLIVLVLGSCLCALLINVRQRDRRYFRWPGIACCAIAMALAAYFRGLGEDENFFLRALLSITLPAAVVCADINLLLMARLRGVQEWFKYACMAGAGVAGLLLAIGLVLPANYPPLHGLQQALLRGGLGLAVAVLACSMLVGALVILNRVSPVNYTASSGLAGELLIVCPRCQLQQALPPGKSACAKCELQFVLQITEPRCPACGYTLYGTPSPQCPECGAFIRDSRGLLV